MSGPFLLTESINLNFVDSPNLEPEEVKPQQALCTSTLETGKVLIIIASGPFLLIESTTLI